MMARFLRYLYPFSLHQVNLKRVVSVGPTLTKLSGSALICYALNICIHGKKFITAYSMIFESNDQARLFLAVLFRK